MLTLKPLLLVTTVILAAPAFSQSNPIEYKTVVISRTQHNLEVKLDDQSVLCSDADYGAKFLKILIPELADITLLNHRNEGAGAPCIAAGMCRSEIFPDGPLPSDVVDPLRPTESVVMTVTLGRLAEINHETRECRLWMTEELEAPIRGFNFVHSRQLELGTRHYEDCL